MEFTEICVVTDQKHKETALAVVQMVSTGIYIEDYENLIQSVKEISHVDLIDDALLEKDSNRVIIHIYLNEFENPAETIDFIKERLLEASCPYELEVNRTALEDWANNWKKYYKPFEIGNSFIIKPEWEEALDSKGRKILNIEPGLAFGTGMHETTKMCILLLETISVKGKTVLDIGCGSGILSIAALLLGAEKAAAVDIDKLAVKTAKRNAQLNGFELDVMAGNLFDNIANACKYDIIFANIVADTIIEAAPKITAYLDEGGVFICSGIIEERAAEVLKTIEDNGLTVCQILKEKGWAAISAKS